jgi:16S rRNA (cytosine1402-N4)-methyltransferase
MSHIPVLLAEIVEGLEPHTGQVIVDATFGAGGYARAFLSSGANVIAFDRDPAAKTAAKKLAQEFPKTFQFIHAPFSEMVEELSKIPSPIGGGLGWGHPVLSSLGAPLLTSPLRGKGIVDAVVFDLGVSSMQLDEAERGFSFRQDGPLDMRMSSDGKSAAGLVNQLSEKEIADILFRYGEEKRSRIIAKAIVTQRKEKPLTRTLELAELIEKTIGRDPRSKIHPATRSFQGLRIAVNDELDELSLGLEAAQKILKPDGKLAVVTFHSLEDRPVKQFFANERAPSRHVPEKELTKAEWRALKPVSPSESEIAKNSRARSAKLRIGVKI